MKWILFAALFFVACTSSQKIQQKQLNGSWQLVAFPAADKSLEEIFSAQKPELHFSDSTMRVTGTTGCNRLSGSYSIDKETFRFGENMILTKMACPGYNETIFLEAVNKINRFQVSDEELRFYRDSGLVMSFVRK